MPATTPLDVPGHLFTQVSPSARASQDALPVRTAAPPAAVTLRAASYNIHRCIGRDGLRDSERVVRVILELDADFIGLQEVESLHQEDHLLTRLNARTEGTRYRAVAGPAVMQWDSHYGNVLLSRWPILATRRHALPVPAGCEPRGALDVDVDVAGHPVRVIVTHFGLRLRERRQQALQLLKLLEVHDQGTPVVILGDFNEWRPWSASLGRLHRALRATPWRGTFPARFPVMALDRIWVRPPDCLIDSGVHRSRLAATASDHLPVLATVHLERSTSDTG